MDKIGKADAAVDAEVVAALAADEDVADVEVAVAAEEASEEVVDVSK